MTTTRDLEKDLSVIIRKAEEINQLSDGLNRRIEEVEAVLSEAKIGLAIEDQVAFEVSGESWLLGYKKIDGAWRISVCKATQWGLQDNQPLASFIVGSSLALVKSPRIVRIEALPNIPRLLKCIQEKQDLFLDALRKTEKSDE